MTFSDIYELMRAYEGGNLIINKRLVGGRVSRFLDIPISYKQVIRDENGNETYYQFFEFKVPERYKRKERIEDYFKKIEMKAFGNSILPITDKEIDRYNEYWDIDFIGKTSSFKEKNSAMLETPKGERYYFSLEEGKELADVFQVFFKPLPYTGGAL